MMITFTLTSKHATRLIALYTVVKRAGSGPRFCDPSELARSLIEAVLDDDASDHNETTALLN